MVKIIESFWFTNSRETIGIVVTINGIGEKKAYIGRGFGFDQKADEKYIAEQGAPVAPGIVMSILKRLE